MRDIYACLFPFNVEKNVVNYLVISITKTMSQYFRASNYRYLTVILYFFFQSVSKTRSADLTVSAGPNEVFSSSVDDASSGAIASRRTRL
jgi:hypothetical protein